MRVAVLLCLMSLSACSRLGSNGAPGEPSRSGERNAPVAIDLPRASGGGAIEVSLGVMILKSGEAFIDGNAVKDDEIITRARSAVSSAPQVRAVISADQGAAYGRVIQIVDLLKQGGVERISFGVEVAPERPRGR